MPDYHCFPLWMVSEKSVGNIDPSSLPISVDLRESLMEWAKRYDATLCMEDPIRSGFSSSQAELEFRSIGGNLKTRLELELGSEFVIVMG